MKEEEDDEAVEEEAKQEDDDDFEWSDDDGPHPDETVDQQRALVESFESEKKLQDDARAREEAQIRRAVELSLQTTQLGRAGDDVPEQRRLTALRMERRRAQAGGEATTGQGRRTHRRARLFSSSSSFVTVPRAASGTKSPAISAGAASSSFVARSQTIHPTDAMGKKCWLFRKTKNDHEASGSWSGKKARVGRYVRVDLARQLWRKNAVPWFNAMAGREY
ncbi:hypothetical protein QYE76_035947 [Lolium multiflorum]|uniref:Uncharacterized protein n=1 Tax=Lolium multiflorum TaxID=4521 RepID=A0AAD8VMN2_LOLMU|nr:hypothetical protein QYE76_035947 [Lolium multiflorum]